MRVIGGAFVAGVRRGISSSSRNPAIEGNETVGNGFSCAAREVRFAAVFIRIPEAMGSLKGLIVSPGLRQCQDESTVVLYVGLCFPCHGAICGQPNFARWSISRFQVTWPEPLDQPSSGVGFVPGPPVRFAPAFACSTPKPFWATATQKKPDRRVVGDGCFHRPAQVLSGPLDQQGPLVGVVEARSQLRKGNQGGAAVRRCPHVRFPRTSKIGFSVALGHLDTLALRLPTEEELVPISRRHIAHAPSDH